MGKNPEADLSVLKSEGHKSNCTAMLEVEVEKGLLGLMDFSFKPRISLSNETHSLPNLRSNKSWNHCHLVLLIFFLFPSLPSLPLFFPLSFLSLSLSSLPISYFPSFLLWKWTDVLARLGKLALAQREGQHKLIISVLSSGFLLVRISSSLSAHIHCSLTFLHHVGLPSCLSKVAHEEFQDILCHPLIFQEEIWCLARISRICLILFSVGISFTCS